MGLLIFTPKEIKGLKLHNSDMKRLLLLLIAALAIPTAANAESHWLILMTETGGLVNLEMESQAECSNQGKAWLAQSERTMGYKRNYMGYACLKGK